jgi:hypothetical protein
MSHTRELFAAFDSDAITWFKCGVAGSVTAS